MEDYSGLRTQSSFSQYKTSPYFTGVANGHVIGRRATPVISFVRAVPASRNIYYLLMKIIASVARFQHPSKDETHHDRLFPNRPFSAMNFFKNIFHQLF
ncbi:hypothetical protein NB643_08565 [Oxalobacter aliiformigenes]|uniref:hypothetical protein n=1 Tax=Oxalobacter aliiformigenes TaxID=2946593 RepID=UPI0022AFCBAD|nr:hypothetical protein [Oxalobacter aliiformigenes]WAV93648.1 hypothetical protein NB641_02555 [Oxalobacter aliiformigenes]WAV94850.1 hypothetical protein NB643_08565 [Oxalobacter aliiformigenes]